MPTFWKAEDPNGPRARSGRLARFPFSLALPLLLACAPSLADSEQAAPLDQSKPIVDVDGRRLLHQDFQRYLEQHYDEDELEDTPAARISAFEDFVVEEALDVRAISLGIEVGEAEVNERLAQWLPEKTSQERGEFKAEALRYVRTQKLLQQEVHSKLSVTPEEAQDYFSQNWSTFQMGDRAHVLEILVSDKSQAEALKRELKAGDGRLFRQLAKQHSSGVTAAQGGDLGFFERGALPKEFDRAIFSLKAGDIGEVFASSLGYHLFLVEERIPRHQQKFYEVQQQIFEQLRAEKERLVLDHYLKQILRDASIDVHDDELREQWTQRRSG